MQRYPYQVIAGALVRAQVRAYLDARNIPFTEYKSWTQSIFNTQVTRDQYDTLQRDMRDFNAS